MTHESVQAANCDFEQLGEALWRCTRCERDRHTTRRPHGECRKPGVVQPRRAVARAPCVHRGDQVGTVECATCPTSRFLLRVFSCELHGQCTLGFGKPIKGKRLQCCIGCADLPEPPAA